MNKIDNISDDASQTMNIVLSNGGFVTLNLNYLPAIQRWNFGISYNDFIAAGMILCTHPNVLRQWKNILPFGLACTTTDGADPVLIDDFIGGRATLYLLESDDVKSVETAIFGAAT